MTALSRPVPSLAWRIAVAAVLLRLTYIALVQAYTLLSPTPYVEQLRESYTQPPVLAPLLANIVSTLLIVGLAAWGATRQWLARRDAATVDQPGRLLATFLALQALYTLCLSSGMAYAQHLLMSGLIKEGSWLQTALGLDVAGRFIVMNLGIRVVTVALEIAGICLALRIAAWTTTPVGPGAGSALTRRHAAWISGLTMLIWQSSVSIMLGGYLQMQTLEAGWAQYALGYWLLPALLLALATFVCLKALPRPLARPGIGRAVALGSLAFWIAQVLGIGLAVAMLNSMSWNQIAWAAQSNVAAVLALLAYGALLTLGCLAATRLLHRKQDAPGR